MIGKLYEYFGVTGILSIVGWVTAVVLLIAYFRNCKRTKYWWIAFAIAIAALGLANLNSSFVSAIEVDRSQEEAEGMRRQKELAAEKDQRKVANIRFAEDAPTDAKDLAGISVEKKSVFEQAASEDDDSRYAYRQKGKQQRGTTSDAGTNKVLLAESDRPKTSEARKLKEADVINANRLDRINLFFARLTYWIALILVVMDYLSRFNKTFDHLYPLPIANRVIDQFWPKTHSVLAPGRARGGLRDYLDNAIRKGENFIYCGPEDPWRESKLPRLAWKRWTFWPISKIVCNGNDDAFDDEFVLESAWFKRHCAVVTDPDRARQLFEAAADFLSMRYLTRASARQTVHLVWDFPSPPPSDALEMMRALARETNFKIVVTARGVPAELFEEVVA